MSFKTWLRVGVTGVLALALSTTIAVAQGQGQGQGHGHGHDKHTTATMMITGAMDAHTALTMTAIPIMTAIGYAAGTVLITQLCRRAWPNAIVFLPDWSAN